jgi:hypothetical protein
MSSVKAFGDKSIFGQLVLYNFPDLCIQPEQTSGPIASGTPVVLAQTDKTPDPKLLNKRQLWAWDKEKNVFRSFENPNLVMKSPSGKSSEPIIMSSDTTIGNQKWSIKSDRYYASQIIVTDSEYTETKCVSNNCKIQVGDKPFLERVGDENSSSTDQCWKGSNDQGKVTNWFQFNEYIPDFNPATDPDPTKSSERQLKKMKSAPNKQNTQANAAIPPSVRNNNNNMIIIISSIVVILVVVAIIVMYKQNQKHKKLSALTL